MPSHSSKTPWESRLSEAAGHVEEDVQRLILYINDEVVPGVRRNGSAVLKSAAAELQRLAERMESVRHQPPGTPPPT